MGKVNKKFNSCFNSRIPKNKRTERNNQNTNTCFRCGSGDHWIADYPKPGNPEKRVHWNKENTKTCVYR